MKKPPACWIPLACISFNLSTHAALSLVGIPSLKQQGFISAGEMSVLLAAFPLAIGMASLFSGVAADLYGRKRVLLFGQALLALSLIAHFLFQDFTPLLVLRIAAGVGSGTCLGLPSTIMSDRYAQDRQRSMFGRSLIGYAIGHTIGIPVSILALNHLHFLTLCGLTGLAQLALLPFLVRSIPTEQTKQTSWLNSKNYLANSRSILQRSRIRLLAITNFIGFFGTAWFSVAIILWFYDFIEFAENELAKLYFLCGCSQVVALFVIAPILKSRKSTTILAASLAANGVILISAGFLSLGTALLFVIQSLVVGTTAIRIPALHYLTYNIGETRHKGMRMSIIQTSGQLGKALGAYLAVAFNAAHTTSHSFILSGSVLLGGAVLSVFLLNSEHSASRSLRFAQENQNTPLRKSEKQSNTSILSPRKSLGIPDAELKMSSKQPSYEAAKATQ